MVLHKPGVGDHHVQNIFTNCLDVTGQLQLLAVQQHHSHLPLHLFSLPTFLIFEKKKRNEAKIKQGITLDS